MLASARKERIIASMETRFKLLLPLLLLLLTLPAALQAQLTFTTNNGTVTITGYVGSVTNLTIPSTINVGSIFQPDYLPVTTIGDSAFQEYSDLASVTIPNSVTSIGEGAFDMCMSMSSLTIGDGVTNIDDLAFSGCTRLNSVTIPNSVISIGEMAFSACGLTNVTIPNSVTNIGASAFSGCCSLISATIGSNVISIGPDAFSCCLSLIVITVDTNNLLYSSLAGVLFDKSQTTLVECPGGKAGSYTIPGGVTSIGDGAFANCTSLTNVTIPDSVTTIGFDAFFECYGLTNITIPSSVTSIGFDAFANCYTLTAITVDTNNLLYSSLAGVLFDKSTNTLIEYPGGKAGSGYTIPGSVTSIAYAAFWNCTGLNTVTIPNSVTSIGAAAFESCSSLTSITIPNSVTNIGDYAFEGCTSMTGVFFQGNAPNLALDVFNCDSNPTVYYLPGSTGWGPTFDGLQTAPWLLPNPLILINNSSFGVNANRFGFIISWATNISVMVEACTNLANQIWSPVSTNTLTNGSSYFTDPRWTNYTRRYYRLRSP